MGTTSTARRCRHCSGTTSAPGQISKRCSASRKGSASSRSTGTCGRRRASRGGHACCERWPSCWAPPASLFPSSAPRTSRAWAPNGVTCSWPSRRRRSAGPVLRHVLGVDAVPGRQLRPPARPPGVQDDWARLQAAIGDAPVSPKQTRHLLLRLKEFRSTVVALVAEETREWIAEFESNLARLRPAWTALGPRPAPSPAQGPASTAPRQTSTRLLRSRAVGSPRRRP